MNINLQESLNIIIGVAAVIGLVYRLAKMEAAIYDAIDKLKDLTIDRINSTESRLAVHLAEYTGKKELVDYQLHALNEKIDHKFNRIYTEIKDVQRFLEKTGFNIRKSEDS